MCYPQHIQIKSIKINAPKKPKEPEKKKEIDEKPKEPKKKKEPVDQQA